MDYIIVIIGFNDLLECKCLLMTVMEDNDGHWENQKSGLELKKM